MTPFGAEVVWQLFCYVSDGYWLVMHLECFAFLNLKVLMRAASR
jgi:hypothetical protein